MGIKLPKAKPIPPTPVNPRWGELHPATTMFLRMEAGSAKAKDGTEYELSTNIGGGNPIIRNLKNGRTWSITWKQLLDLAVENGLNEPLTSAEQERWGRASK